jgi:hypothetical protein
MMGAWAIGVFSVAAVVNQIAIALFRRAQTATEPDLHQEPSPELQSGRWHRIRRVASAEPSTATFVSSRLIEAARSPTSINTLMSVTAETVFVFEYSSSGSHRALYALDLWPSWNGASVCFWTTRLSDVWRSPSMLSHTPVIAVCFRGDIDGGVQRPNNWIVLLGNNCGSEYRSMTLFEIVPYTNQ